MVKNRIQSSDTQRCIRAYEVKLSTNKSIFNWYKNTQSNYEQKDFFKIYVDFPRNELLERINLRAQEMENIFERDSRAALYYI